MVFQLFYKSIVKMRILQILMVLPYILTPIHASVAELQRFMHTEYENNMTETCYKMVQSRLEFQTDIMNDTKMETYMEDLINIYKTHNEYVKKIKTFEVPFIIDDVYFARELKRASVGLSFDTDDMLKKNSETYIRLDKAFNIAKICPYDQQNCNLKEKGLSLSEIEDIMAESRDYDELLYLWKSWRQATAGIKKLFKTYFNMEEEIAHVNNFSSIADYQQFFYDNLDTLGYTLDLWKEVEPLYLELHKYVGRKLKQHYGDKLNTSDGLLPAHVLGNMWAESWYQIEPLVRPFPNVSDGNLEANMKKKFEVADIFRAADEFFHSLGLEAMGSVYRGPGQMFTRPTDGREVACHPSSSDLCNGTYRVTLCGKVNLENFINIHHELGHVQYFMQYKNLPFALRDSASPAFHETIGETLALSATSPSHLQKLNLLTDYQDSYESSINYLMKMALIKVAFLPFGMIVDMWKWEVTSKEVPEDRWNSHWWSYRTKYQRVKPPIPRSDATDFDPAAKYHVAVNADFMSYFHAHFMEFQIYKGLCLVAHEYDQVSYKMCPLHNCDFYNSREVGDILTEVMRSGYQKPWTVVLKELTGSDKISSGPLLEYFEPLYQFLKMENEKADREKPVTHILKHMGDHHTFIIIASVIIIVMILLVVYFKCLRRRRVRWFHLFFQ